MSGRRARGPSNGDAKTRWRSAAMAGLALMTAVACADGGPWQKPGVSTEQLAGDRAACRREATVEAERDLVLTEERSRGAHDSRTGAYMTQMNRFSAGRDREDLYERCMMRLGYTREAGSDPESRFEALSEPAAEPPAEPGRR